jgi:hypothetical protein
MDVPHPRMERRLQKRYLGLVQQYMDAATALAAGIHALPQVGGSFAAAQAAWRFFVNEEVTLPRLVEPLRESGRQAAALSSSAYALLVHDWSKIDYDGHASKTDQVKLSNSLDFGYEQTTALLVDAATGLPLAPMEISVLAADGRHTTAHEVMQPPIPHLDQILPVMQASQAWGVDKRLVHIIDREGDSLLHMRQWQQDEHLFLVRADDRRVRFREHAHLLTEIVQFLRQENEFHFVRDVEIRNKPGKLFVAETAVILDGAAWQRDEDDKKYRVPGSPLTVRFVVAQVRNESGKVIAEWLLLTSVPAEVAADLIATWYYWRWKIETFHKLIKSAGLQMEEWQQETARAITKRLVVACMACVVVWQLESHKTPAAQACKKFLMDLSGRQTKRTRPVTTSGLLAGLHTLLVMLGVLEQYTPDELRNLADTVLSPFCPSG